MVYWVCKLCGKKVSEKARLLHLIHIHPEVEARRSTVKKFYERVIS